MTTRQRKTPQQRAQEQLDVANRAVIRLDRKVDALRIELAQLDREHRDAIARRDHLAHHPDLKPETRTTTSTEESTA